MEAIVVSLSRVLVTIVGNFWPRVSWAVPGFRKPLLQASEVTKNSGNYILDLGEPMSHIPAVDSEESAGAPEITDEMIQRFADAIAEALRHVDRNSWISGTTMRHHKMIIDGHFNLRWVAKILLTDLVKDGVKFR